MSGETPQHPFPPFVTASGSEIEQVGDSPHPATDFDDLIQDGHALYEKYAKIVARNDRAVLARMIAEAAHLRPQEEYVTGYSLVL